MRTTIGKGSAKENTAKVHGAPLGPEDLANLKAKFGLDPAASYAVGDDVYAYFRAHAAAGAAKHAAWDAMYARYAAAHPELAAQFARTQAGELPAGWEAALPSVAPGDKTLATRQSLGLRVRVRDLDRSPLRVGPKMAYQNAVRRHKMVNCHKRRIHKPF